MTYYLIDANSTCISDCCSCITAILSQLQTFITMNKQLQLLNKIAQIMAEAVSKIHQITGQYMQAHPEQFQQQTPTRVNPQDQNHSLPPPKRPLTYEADHSDNQESASPQSAPPLTDQSSFKGVSAPTTQPQPLDSAYRVPKQRPKPHIPPPPKAPMTSYLVYSIEIGPLIRKQQPQLSMAQVSKVTGEMWKMLTPEKKQPYEEAYRQQRMRYKEQLEEYYRRYPNAKRQTQKSSKK